MTRDPILASRNYKDRVPMVQIVHGGLHYIKGNSSPHFSLTSRHHRRGFPHQCQSGGCDHEDILKHFPRFADLAALHLSDMDGAPMHAEANGWYSLAAAMGGFGEQYHAGNSERHYPKPEGAPRRGEWDNTDYRKPTRSECLQIFTDHCRITLPEAQAIVEQVDPLNWREGQHAEQENPGYRTNCRARWAIICESLRPRWKEQAEACIKNHNLRVYGDEWQAA